MRIAVRAEALLERLALWLGLAPVPLLETHISVTAARAIMAGVELDVFDTLADAPLTAEEVAARCRTDATATARLLRALTACGYLVLTGDRFALAPVSRKWLLRGGPRSIRDKVLFQSAEWRWLEQLEDFIRTGRALDFHGVMTSADWDLYQRSMRAVAGIAGREVGRRTPVPRGARTMLDLGGSHGHYAAAICRRHPRLRAVVLDLPQAVERAAPLLAAEGLGDRVTHVAGEVVGGDLGTSCYDLIFASNLAHHLSAAENRALARKVARALRPGGFFVIQDLARLDRPGRGGQVPALLDLYFAFQSGAGTWSVPEMAGWQAEAGLRVRRPIRLRTAPGWVQQAARK